MNNNFCSSCGQPKSANLKFCGHCGFGDATSSSQQEPPVLIPNLTPESVVNLVSRVAGGIFRIWLLVLGGCVLFGAIGLLMSGVLFDFDTIAIVFFGFGAVALILKYRRDSGRPED